MMDTTFTPAELTELLGRPARARLDADLRAAIAGQRIAVTGAAGSIGSELAREVAACAPRRLMIVDHHELGLFMLERELLARWPGVPLVACLGDVTHAATMRRACRECRPDVVYHAAAYKHVTMAERSPAVAARVNVLGSIAVAEAAAAVGARFVLISSDKAADPRSVMGATKRLAEMATLARATARFRPIVVRFGNVIGSSGSVVPLMRQAIRRGEPLRLTDPDATRYFMSADEAVSLVIRADLLARAPEIFWLDMGAPVRLGDLADRLIALERRSGHTPAGIEIIGLRPGEKRNETLADPGLTFHRTIDRRILAARDTGHARAIAGVVTRLARAAARASDRDVLEVIAAVLPGFEPSVQARAAGIASSHAGASGRGKTKRRGFSAVVPPDVEGGRVHGFRGHKLQRPRGSRAA
ncbi:MAG: polysaccharide biosynthesis protein [Acidobacteria bacterium]|nr:polysaccharide biosynthesis protein [Acidobacteriota bacterium]